MTAFLQSNTPEYENFSENPRGLADKALTDLPGDVLNVDSGFSAGRLEVLINRHTERLSVYKPYILI